MVSKNVQSTARTSATPDRVWHVVRDFCAPWHPLVKSMKMERGHDGAAIRAFTVADDDTLYREQLTYFSDSERCMAYRHIEGITGADSYNARLLVSPTQDGGSIISMTAHLSAEASRAAEIAHGTQMIFDLGTKAISALAETDEPKAAPISPKPDCAKITTKLIDDLPQLAVSVIDGTSETLVLFLHGIGGGRGNWDAQLSAIAPTCPAAALDLRGYGDSTLGSAQSTIEDYCGDILRVCDVLGAKKLVLCGLSYGAWIATSFAMRHPEMLAGLVLSGGCTGMSEAGPDERDAFRLSREVPMDEGQSPADFAPSVVNIIAGPTASPDARAGLLASMAAIPAETYRDALRCFTNPLEKFDFSKLNLPVLMITGQHDRLAPPHEIKNVADRIWDAAAQPNVRFETIAGAGHVCNLEQPAAFNQILQAFVRQVVS